MKMKELTKAEEQIMQLLWEQEKGFVKDIIEQIPEPKPAYNTVSTIIRILEKKGFVGHNAYGKTHEYFPLISKESYRAVYMDKAISDFFSDSYSRLVSQFAQEEKISVSELKEIIKLIEKNK